MMLVDARERGGQDDAVSGAYTVELGRSNDRTACNCCGGIVRLVRGFVYRDGFAWATYVVRWTLGRPQHRPSIVVSMGRWGEEGEAADRSAVVLEHNIDESGAPVLEPVDAETSFWAPDREFLGNMLSRDAAFTSGFAQEAADVLVNVGEQDPRVDHWRLDGIC
jgi:hypothetical protein